MVVFRPIRLEGFVTDNFPPTTQMAHGPAPQLALDESALALEFRVGDICRFCVGLAGDIDDHSPRQHDSSASFYLSFFSLIETT